MRGEVKRLAVQPMPRGLGGVRSPRTEVGECKLRLSEEIVPPVGGEGEMSGGKCGDDVVFGGTDVPFRRECAMVMGGGKLDVKGTCAEKVGELFRGFVVDLQCCNIAVTSAEERQR